MSEAFAHRYRLLNRIAVGGTAEVFRAVYVTADGSERPVVIKRVLPQFASDERFRRIFHEEACVAVTMSHPSIVRVLDHGELGQTCFIALELVEGKDLGSLLAAAVRSGQIPSPRLCAYVAAQVAEALEFIHVQTSSEGTPLQIIHRDVSPQNILVSYSGEVKLTDFGIAKSAIRREQTVDGTLRGKLDYMAPEQAQLSAVDSRADIFGLGCVLFEMLHGTPPCRGENELDTLQRVRDGRITVPPGQQALPAALQKVLDRALAPALEARYQRAAEMAADLRAYLQEVGSPSPENLGRWIRELEATPASTPQNSLDDAVRNLLGGGDPDDPHADGTAMFASQPGQDRLRSPGEPATATGPPKRGRQIALSALLMVSLAGWLLWALGPSGGKGNSGEPGRSDARLVVPGLDHRRASARDDVAGAAASTLLRSQPSGAMVYVDGQPQGRTPLGLNLPRAAFRLEMQKDGYRPWRHQLDPASLGASLVVSLMPVGAPQAQSTITINTLPWSRVRLDGKLVGNTPLVRHVVRAGIHRLELLAPDDALRKLISFSVAPGANRAFTFDFSK